jgi:8-oxo-dGTP diphosphatase
MDDSIADHGTGLFTIRVYGLLINERGDILLSDEFRYNTRMTKFPGGGLTFGEGPEDCLLREAMEEFGQPAEIIEHYYTTGFFQKAMFFENHQLISIYYRIRLRDPLSFMVSAEPFGYSAETDGSQSFRWKSLAELKTSDLTFPIDRHVAGLLIRDHESLTGRGKDVWG